MELRFISLFGWLVMISIAWAISYNRKLFPWRTVIWGIGLQFTLALLILKTPWGKDFFDFAGKVVQKLHPIFQRRLQIRFRSACRFRFAGKSFRPRQFRHLRNSRHGHDHHRRRHFVATLSLGRFAKNRSRRRVGDAQNHAHKRQRNAFRLREHFHGPDRGAADDPALRPAHDARAKS